MSFWRKLWRRDLRRRDKDLEQVARRIRERFNREVRAAKRLHDDAHMIELVQAAATSSGSALREVLEAIQSQGLSKAAELALLRELRERRPDLEGSTIRIFWDSGQNNLILLLGETNVELGSAQVQYVIRRSAGDADDDIDPDVEPSIDLVEAGEAELTPAAVTTIAAGLDALFRRLGPPPDHLRTGQVPLLHGGGGAAE